MAFCHIPERRFVGFSTRIPMLQRVTRITTGHLSQHLAEIDQACENRMELIIRQVKVQEGVTEELKAADQMEWVRRLNNIQNRAEEIVLHELVYC